MEFCDDLLVEILSRLPFKSLARFKCVSRSWRALISGGDLRRRLPLLPAGLFVHAPRDGDGGGGEPRYATACAGAGGLEYCDTSFFPLVEPARVVDACEGLLLYRSLSAASALYVACPATRKWAALPVPRREAQLPLLAFDPADSGGSPSPHYHVVCFVAWQERGATLDVFSSETGAWAEHDAVFGGVEASSLSPTTHYRGGILHVLAYPDRVVLMDLAATMSTTMVLCRLAPRLPDDVDAGARLGHSRGRLHYAKCDGERLRVWALDGGDGASPGSCQWILTNTIRVNEMTINGGRWAASEVKFLAFHPDMADVVYLSSSAGKVANCDMRKKEIVSSWKLGAEHHVVRFWLLGLSSGLMSCLGGEQTCQLASAS